MSTTYDLGCPPFWREVYPDDPQWPGLAGQPVVGGKVYTYYSTSHSTPKATYSSNQGSPPPANTNPVVLNADGEAIIYWVFDDTNPTDLYYIVITDPNDVVIYTRDFYCGPPIPISQVTPSVSEALTLARNGQFAINRFRQVNKLKYDISGGSEAGRTWVCDDWLWNKSNNTCDETVSILSFTAGDSDNLSDAPCYLSWEVISPGSGETFKNIYQNYDNVQSFSGQQIAFQIKAKSSAGTTFSVVALQYFGTGGSPSANVETPIIPSTTLTTEYTTYSAVVTIPSIAGKTVGTTNPGYVSIQLRPPLNAGGGANIQFTNYQLNVASTVPAFQYQTVQQQQSMLNKNYFNDPTGMMTFGIETSRLGWFILRDTSATDSNIGDANSGADVVEASYAWGLYNYLWNNTSQADCPVSSGARGASADADFDAHYRICLPRVASRLIGAAGHGNGRSNRALADFGGSETTSDYVSHQHTFATDQIVAAVTANYDGVLETNNPGAGGRFMPYSLNNIGVTNITHTDNAGTGSTVNIMNPFSFLNFFIKF